MLGFKPDGQLMCDCNEYLLPTNFSEIICEILFLHDLFLPGSPRRTNTLFDTNSDAKLKKKNFCLIFILTFLATWSTTRNIRSLLSFFFYFVVLQLQHSIALFRKKFHCTSIKLADCARSACLTYLLIVGFLIQLQLIVL